MKYIYQPHTRKNSLVLNYYRSTTWFSKSQWRLCIPCQKIKHHPNNI